MEVITMQVIEEKVTITVLAIYVIVIIQTKIKKTKQNTSVLREVTFLCGQQELG